MVLEQEYEKLDDVPEHFHELYTEKAGKFVFTGVNGIALTGDQKKLRDEAGSWRIKHKEVNTALDSWKALGKTPEEVRTIMDGLPELQAAAEAGGGKSKEAVAAQVEASKKALEVTHARALGDTTTKLTAAEQRITFLEGNERKAAIKDYVLKAIGDSKGGKINPDAIEDVLLYAAVHLETDEERDEKGNLIIKTVRTKDGVGVTPGLEPMAWLSEMAPRKGHWYMPSEGGGSNGSQTRAPGGNSNNPWSAKSWNVTAQGAYVREHGMDKASQMAKAAGTTIGAPPATTGPRPEQPRRSQGGIR